MIAIVLVVLSYVILVSTLFLSYELSSYPSIPPFWSDKYIKLYHSLNTIYSKKNNIHVVCLFSCIAVDDDIDDLTSISKIMIILCYLSWSVDFWKYNDDDKNGDDDNDDNASTVYATD